MSTTRINKRQAAAVAKLEDDRLAKLLNERRFCYVIPIDGYVEGHGFRVSIAIENEQGHYPTGNLRVLDGDYSNGATMPWFWGDTYDEACKHCEEMNASTFGYTPLEAAKIVMSTMGGSKR